MIDRLGWSAYAALHMPGQASFPFRPAAVIRHAQARRIQELCRHAYLTVPFYREAMRARGLDPTDFRSESDLTKLPYVERSQVQRDPEYYVSTARPLSSYRKVRTSGSSGAPLTAYWDWPAHFRTVAYAQRYEGSGLRRNRWLGSRLTVIAPPSGSRRAGRDDNRRKAVVPQRWSSRQELSMFADPSINVPFINEFQPDTLITYGSYLADLFLYVQRSGVAMHRVGTILYGGDGLAPPVRQAITELWRTRVQSVYQAVEVANIAFDCGHGLGLHVNIDICPIRIVDENGMASPIGTPGEVVVSNLVNHATVLLNYRIGDLASWLPRACRCGRAFPLLSHVDGRSDDWIERGDGSLVHPQNICQLFRGEEHVWEFQVRQAARQHLDVSIVAAPSGNRAGIADRLREKLAASLGAETQVDIEFREELPRGAGGKRRAVVSARCGDRYMPTSKPGSQ